jgi:hypothetical protein
MMKKWIAINLLLLLFAAIAGRQLYVSVQEFKAENDLSDIQPDRSLSQRTAQETILPPPITDIRYNASDFAVIPEKSLFLESRSMDGSSTTPSPTGTMPAAQKPKLVGVILTEDRKMASIIGPSGRGRNNEALWIHVGDEYEGYKITEIASDHIVLDNGSQREIITMADSSQAARRGRTNVVPTRVVSIGGGATTGNIPVSVVAGGSSAPPTPPATPVRTVNPETNTRNVNNVVAVSGIQTGGQQTTANPTAGQQQQENVQTPKTTPAAPVPGNARRNPRVIRTPFGDIIRPDP